MGKHPLGQVGGRAARVHTALLVLRHLAVALAAVLIASSGVNPTNAQDDPNMQCQDQYTSTDTACLLTGNADIHDYLTQSGDRRVYRFEVPAAGALLQIDLVDLPADYDLYMTDAASDILAQSVHEGLTPESVSVRLQDPQTIFVYVVSDPTREVAPDKAYHLVFQATLPPSAAVLQPVAQTDAPVDASSSAVPAPTVTPLATQPLVATPTPAPIAPVTISVTPADVSWPRNVTVTWANISTPRKDDVIGLFRVGADDGSFGPNFYTSCETQPIDAHASGSCSFSIDPTSGAIQHWMGGTVHQAQWEFRLYAGGTFGVGPRLATSNPLTISWGGTPVVPVNTTLSTDAHTVSKVQNVNINWNNIPDPRKENWMGLFLSGADDGSSKQGWYVSCEQVPIAAAASGSCSVQIDPTSAAVENFVNLPGVRSGQFEFRLFSATLPYGVRLAKSQPFTITVPQAR